MILEEEYNEAWNAELGCQLAATFVGLGAVIGWTALYAGVSWVLIPAVALSLVTVGVGVVWWRCRRTIKAWRDQKRAAEMAKQDPSRPAPCPNCARKQETPPWGAYRS